VTQGANGKTVFVTGGAKGIGKAIVTALAADGFDVSFSYSASADEAGKLRDELQARYPAQSIKSHCFDLGDRAQVDELAALIGDTDVCTDWLQCGPAYDTLAALVDWTTSAFQEFLGADPACRPAAPLMRARSGRILVSGRLRPDGRVGNPYTQRPKARR
jgi:NAD(P)-dependent dehydrogenase (short-subunit alcohol dehydrogenase family)